LVVFSGTDITKKWERLSFHKQNKIYKLKGGGNKNW
jgi:hypothetical protein